MSPDLRPFFSTGHHDEQGIASSHLLGMGSELQTWPHFLVTTPTIVATVDAAVVTAIVVLVGLAVEAPTADAVAAGGVAFLVAWGALFSLQRLILRVLRHAGPRIPTPPDEPERAGSRTRYPTKIGRRDSDRGVLAPRWGLPAVSAESRSRNASSGSSSCGPWRGRMVRSAPESSRLPITRT